LRCSSDTWTYTHHNFPFSLHIHQVASINELIQKQVVSGLVQDANLKAVLLI
jgi:hypothetical protein